MTTVSEFSSCIVTLSQALLVEASSDHDDIHCIAIVYQCLCSSRSWTVINRVNRHLSPYKQPCNTEISLRLELDYKLEYCWSLISCYKQHLHFPTRQLLKFIPVVSKDRLNFIVIFLLYISKVIYCLTNVLIQPILTL